MTVVHLIRHGKATPDKASYDELHPIGQEQSRRLGAYLAARDQRFDAIYCGPLQRQADTLRIMREAAGATAARWPTTVVLDGLAEAPLEAIMRHCLAERLPGDVALQGLLHALGASTEPGASALALESLLSYLVERWVAGEFERPGIESAADFGRRVLGAFSQVLAEQPGAAHVAVITSGGVIGWLVAHAQGLPEFQRTGGLGRFLNTSITRIEATTGGLGVIGLNALDHLADPALETFI